MSTLFSFRSKTKRFIQVSKSAFLWWTKIQHLLWGTVLENAVTANINLLALLISDHHTKIKNLVAKEADLYFKGTKSVKCL
jgi:hypothetical protein